MYQVLYRKWRPRRFSDVSGQPNITATLKNSVKKDKISHAYLFTGSRGTGKTTCAKILAKAINCLSPVDGDPCNECEICRGIDNGSILDVVEIDAASNNSVDNIRELREETNYTPAKAKYRVYIIDEVHMLSTGAFNALLKTLEEPPEYVVFILATTEVHKIPNTILSRCQRFDFRRIPAEDIAGRLTYISEQEGKRLEPDAAMLAARLADGALRDALSLLDLCFDNSDVIDEQTVSRAAGLSDRGYIYEISDAVEDFDLSRMLTVIDKLHRASCDMQRLCSELLLLFRNYMIIKSTPDYRQIIVSSASDMKIMEEKASGFTVPRILSVMDTLQNSLANMSRGSDRRTEMEIAGAKLCTRELQNDYEGLVSRIEILESRMTAAVPVDHIVRNESPEREIPEKPAEKDDEKTENSDSAAPGPKPADEQIVPFSKWKDVMKALKETNGLLYSVLNGAKAYIRNGEMALIEPSDPTFAEIVKKDNNSSAIKQALYNVTGVKYKLAVMRPKQRDKGVDSDPLAKFINKFADDIDRRE